MTDPSAIVSGLIEGDEKITQQFFYQNCRPLLYDLIGKYFTVRVDYDELVSELYIHLMDQDAKRLRSYNGNSSIYRWLQTVARNLFLDLKKQGRVIENVSQERLYEIAEGATDPTAHDSKMDVEILLDQIENERYRLVLKRLVLEGMEPEELAKALGVSKANLYNIKKRAMDKLKQIARIATTSGGALCAIQCEEFILHVFGIHKTLQELCILASTRHWLKDDGVELLDLGAIPEHYGLVVNKRAPGDLDSILRAMRAGHQVIVAVDGGELVGNPAEELAEDFLAGGVTDHCVVILSVDTDDGTVALYDPAFGVIPLEVPTERFLDAWEDSNYYMVTVKQKVAAEEETYTPHPIDLEGIELTPQLEQLREAIAENAHEVWAVNRIKEGWTYGPERDDKRKTHPDLVPYSKLTDGEKQYDRDSAMYTIKLLIKLGYDLVKR